jgi:hypothetical protein
MKCEVKKTYYGVVSATYEVTFPLADQSESEELRQALAVVQRYQETAAKAVDVRVHSKDPNCDWVMFEFAVKNDKVVVTVESGACG